VSDPESSDGTATGDAAASEHTAGRRTHLGPAVCSAHEPALSLDRLGGRGALDGSPGRRSRAVPLPSQANHALLSTPRTEPPGPRGLVRVVAFG